MKIVLKISSIFPSFVSFCLLIATFHYLSIFATKALEENVKKIVRHRLLRYLLSSKSSKGHFARKAFDGL